MDQIQHFLDYDNTIISPTSTVFPVRSSSCCSTFYKTARFKHTYIHLLTYFALLDAASASCARE